MNKIEQIIAEEGYLIYPVKGISMLPMLDEDRDLVELVPITERPKKYDVVLFSRSDGEYVLHRIIKIKRRYCVICGDNCTEPEAVPLNKIIAVAKGFFKSGNYVSCNDENYMQYVRERCGSIAMRNIVKKERTVPAEWTALVALLRAAITGAAAPTLGDVDYAAILNLAKKHSVAATIFSEVDKEKCPREVYPEWENCAHLALRKKILFEAERRAVVSEFERLNIKYLPLKGIIINEMYPENAIREFADNDILIEKSHKNDVRKIMTSRGYALERGDIHDSYLKAPVYNFEFHFELFSRSAPFYKKFKRAWRTAISDGGNAYRMTNEDFYLYFVGHFYKHYAYEGAGLRFFADIYIIKKRFYESFNHSYVSGKLKECGLEEFERQASETALKMFEGTTPLSYNELSYIMESGTFGSVSHYVENGIKRSGKARYLFRRAFPGYWYMRTRYRAVAAVPVLLPIFWFVRLLSGVFNKKTSARVKFELEKMNGMKRS